jgi:hypothetical protein
MASLLVGTATSGLQMMFHLTNVAKITIIGQNLAILINVTLTTVFSRITSGVVMRKGSATAVTRSSTTTLVIIGRMFRNALMQRGGKANIGMPNSPARTTQMCVRNASRVQFPMESAPSGSRVLTKLAAGRATDEEAPLRMAELRLLMARAMTHPSSATYSYAFELHEMVAAQLHACLAAGCAEAEALLLAGKNRFR